MMPRSISPFSNRFFGAATALLLATCGGGTIQAQEGMSAAPYSMTEQGRFNEPWAMAFLPDGRALVTEKSGQLKLWRDKGNVTPVSGAPKVSPAGQGGLGDVVLHPDFPRNQMVYLSWVEAEGDVKGAAVGRARLIEDSAGARLDG
ncbi:MAG: hypothetical protein EBS21_09755, partial [Sphingomonadaceae bacterium]|nr:hypothetical protein [Sphingomonadaceae bacterium]